MGEPWRCGPSIQRGLHIDDATLQWTVAAYTLAFALLLITGGRLFFTLLDDGIGFAAATQRSLWLEIGLFLASALLSFLLPAGPVRTREAAPAEDVPSAG